jgi:hypothetical protein
MLNNPYAAPQSVDAPFDGSQPSSYADERRSLWMMMLLSVITLGVYPSVWIIRRARFLDGLRSDRKVGPLGWINLALLVVLFVVTVFMEVLVVLGEMDEQAADGFGRLLEIGSGLVSLFVQFRVAGILRNDFAATRRRIRVSGGLVFFLGTLHLQHVINKAADMPEGAERE